MDDDELVAAGCLVGGCLAYVLYIIGVLALIALIILALVKYVFGG